MTRRTGGFLLFDASSTNAPAKEPVHPASLPCRHHHLPPSALKRAVPFDRRLAYIAGEIVGEDDRNRCDADPARRSIGARRNPDSADAILKAAETVLVEAGYAGFSIEAVARRARAGKPTIYRWWPSKAALLLEGHQRQKRVDVPDTGRLEDDLVGFLEEPLRALARHIFRQRLPVADRQRSRMKPRPRHLPTMRWADAPIPAEIVERAKARGEIGVDINSRWPPTWSPLSPGNSC